MIWWIWLNKIKLLDLYFMLNSCSWLLEFYICSSYFLLIFILIRDSHHTIQCMYFIRTSTNKDNVGTMNFLLLVGHVGYVWHNKFFIGYKKHNCFGKRGGGLYAKTTLKIYKPKIRSIKFVCYITFSNSLRNLIPNRVYLY
jgi:hypothetical protein